MYVSFGGMCMAAPAFVEPWRQVIDRKWARAVACTLELVYKQALKLIGQAGLADANLVISFLTWPIERNFLCACVLAYHGGRHKPDVLVIGRMDGFFACHNRANSLS